MSNTKTSIPEKYANKTIYSFSRLDLFHTCKHAYYLGYVLRLKGKDNIYSALGTIAHELLEDLQASKITNDEALQKFNLKVFEIMQVQGLKFTNDKIKDNFLNSIIHYMLNYKPIECKEFLSETRFYTDIFDVPITGFIDGVVLKEDNSVEILDYKTSSLYKGDKLKEHGRQLVLYAYAIKKEFGITASKIYWNFLKYCYVCFQGKTKQRRMFTLRTNVVKTIASELTKDLRELGMTNLEADILINQSIVQNSLQLMPKEIQDKYSIEDGIVEYDFTDETIIELCDFVANTEKSINENLITNDWTACDISKNSYFCSQLCSYSQHCQHYKNYLEDLQKQSEVKFEEKQSSTFNILDLFS